jgi:hypothetical protein
MKKTLQQLFIASCMLTSIATQAAWPEGINSEKFDLYIKKACLKLDKINVQLQLEQLNSSHTISGQDYADILYARRIAAFKDIFKEIKSNKDDKHDEILHQHFKKEVYKSWKREFKNHYKESAQNNDIHAWDWVYRAVNFPIHE